MRRTQPIAARPVRSPYDVTVLGPELDAERLASALRRALATDRTGADPDVRALRSERFRAPMSGVPLERVALRVELPGTIGLEALVERVERLAEDLGGEADVVPCAARPSCAELARDGAEAGREASASTAADARERAA